MQWITMQRNTMQLNTMHEIQYNAIQSNVLKYSVIQFKNYQENQIVNINLSLWKNLIWKIWVDHYSNEALFE